MPFSSRPIGRRHLRKPRHSRRYRFRFGGLKRLWPLLQCLWTRRPSSLSGWKKLIFRLILAGIAFVFLYIFFLWLTLPDAADPAQLLASQSTVITDRNGVELYRLYSEEDRTYIPGETIPLHMKQAMISIEDERFYDRGCIDWRAILRAVFANIFDFKSQGGSTITQQLARNALLTREKRISRKVKELMLSCQLEGSQTKDELLELYLNWIPFGQNAYGLEQASQVYFGISASDLSLAQSAVLAALPQRPSYFSPYGRHVHTEVSDLIHNGVISGEITKSSQIESEEVTIGLLGSYAGTGSSLLYVGGRTDQVLKNMEDQGFIEESERLTALEELEEMTFEPSREDIRAAHFVIWVREQLEEMFGTTSESGLLEQGGLTIETTLDWNLQEAAEGVVEKHREYMLEMYGARNMALVSMDPETREVLAYVGNMDFHDEEFGGKIDMTLAARQPGSSFKPIVYASAFQKGYSPATPIYDVPTKIGDDVPQNFDGEFQGLLSMRQALGASRNIPAAKAFFLGGGERNILQLSEALGAPGPSLRKQQLIDERGEFDYGWPLALGAAETPLFQMVQAYTTFADEGRYSPAVRIRKITDKHGNILFEIEGEPDKDTALDPRIAYQITSVLSDEWARPEEYWKSQLTVPGYQTAAKTGTSNKCLEWSDDEKERRCLLRKPDNAWLLGYTPNLVTGVWVGNADSSAMYEKAGGLNTASPIWRDYMMAAHRLLESPKTEFEAPEGIVQPQVSLLSGELPTSCTPVELRRADVFLSENAPSKQDPACRELTVDRVTGLLASEGCPTDALYDGSFLVAKSLLPDRWPKWEEGVQEWVLRQMELWTADESHSGSLLPLPIAPEEACDPTLTPGRMVQPKIRIVSPQAGGLVSYPSFKPRISYEVGSTVREVRYYIDGRLVKTMLTSPYVEPLLVPRSVSRDGVHTLEVELVDEYYNVARTRLSIRFGIDSSSPYVRFVYPEEGFIVKQGEKLAITVEAADPDGGLKYVQFYLGDKLLTTKPREPFTLEYEFDTEPGSYVLRAVAEDLAKNRSEDRLQIFVE